MKELKHVVCFSGGHSSAITAIEVARKFGKENTILLNHDLCPRTENADIKRFKNEVADYLDIPITYANYSNWKTDDQFDVCIKASAFKVGIGTALCTNRLKTEPFKRWLKENYPVSAGDINQDIIVSYGFDAKEQNRINRRLRIMNEMGYQTEYPLTWGNRTILNTEDIGIKKPIVYDIFNHANCTGCLKAGKQHWFIVYCLYPEIWEKAKDTESQIGYSILKNTYLTELESEFSKLRCHAMPPTEKIIPQKFWAIARKLVGDDNELPCECSF